MTESCCIGFPPGAANLDLSEVHRLPDQFVVFWQLFSRWQLDEHLAQLTPTSTAGSDIIKMTNTV